MQIPPGLSTLFFDLSLNCIPSSHILEQADQLDQDPQTQGQGWILQLFCSYVNPVQIPPGLSSLLFILVRDSIPASHVLEHDDQRDQGPQMHGQDVNLQFFCSLDNPLHVPPYNSSWLLDRVRVWIPVSQVLEQEDHLDQEFHLQSTAMWFT